jgi:predicted AAA+ superfamily ATPase
MARSFCSTALGRWAGVRWPTLIAFVSRDGTQTGQEVDVVMENRAGRLVGVEVKAGATVAAAVFKGLQALAETAGRRFHRGVILYTGTEPAAFGKNVYALPMSALWTLGGAPS